MRKVLAKNAAPFKNLPPKPHRQTSGHRTSCACDRKKTKKKPVNIRQGKRPPRSGEIPPEKPGTISQLQPTSKSVGGP